MTLHQHAISDADSGISSNLRSQKSWNWLALARILWIVLAFVLVIIFLANIPSYYQSLHSFCTQPSPFDCQTGRLTLGNVQALSHLHLSTTVSAALLATFSLIVSVLYWAIGLLIFWRKSGEWVGLITSLTCIMLGAINIFGFPVAQTPQLVQLLTNFIANVLLVRLLSYLPDGSIHSSLDMGCVRSIVVSFTAFSTNAPSDSPLSRRPDLPLCARLQHCAATTDQVVRLRFWCRVRFLRHLQRAPPVSASIQCP